MTNGNLCDKLNSRRYSYLNIILNTDVTPRNHTTSCQPLAIVPLRTGLGKYLIIGRPPLKKIVASV